jgi:thiamine-monophosphate kinase
VNLSDVAAMGGSPRAALLSLSLPPGWPEAGIGPFTDAFAALAREHGVAVVGGNITSSPGPMVVGVTLSGSVRPRRILTRAGGRPGDDLYVTGTVGAALAGLLWLRGHPSLDEPADEDRARCVRRYRRPDARVRVGVLLGRNRVASACMDSSDGLADAVRQVCHASGTGARIDAELLPIPAGAISIFEDYGKDPARSACEGGDDYELLLAVPARKRRALEAIGRLSRGVPITRIGGLTREPVTLLVNRGHEEELPRGFAHF